MKNLTAALLLFFALQTHAALSFVSAVRPPALDASFYLAKAVAISTNSSTAATDTVSAMDARKPSALAGEFKWVEWTQDSAQLLKAFDEIRDERFIASSDALKLRRPSWLYPDDGCFARAEIVSRRLVEKGYAAPSRVFVFGNLKVLTPFALNKESVTWWYHVAIGYKVGDQLFILDPALENKMPLLIQDWKKIMAPTEDIAVAVCDENAFTPYGRCKKEAALKLEEALKYQTYFFEPEWKNIEQLGRDPVKDLGDTPPWL